VKFVHAADIHLDSPLRGLERYDGAPVDEIRGATRRAVENLIDLCLRESVDLLVIAGDLYDGDWRDYNTGLFFVSQIARLTKAGIRVAWVRGNHDAASQITRSLAWPDGAIDFDTREPSTHVFEDLGVALHGQSYGQREVLIDLAAHYPAPLAGLFNLGILHTALDGGREGHAPYAPCSLDRLQSRGYDYWALGHVHRREVVSEDPWIVFPGNLQGRNAREVGPKGATLVHVEDGAVASVHEHPLDVVRWVDCAIDASDAVSGDDVVDRVRRALESECASVGDRWLAARLRIVGASAADAPLRASREHWRQQLRATSLGVAAPVWIEKILIETRPQSDPSALLQHDDPIADLLRSLRSAVTDTDLRTELVASLAPLASKLPQEYRDLPEAIDLESAAALDALLEALELELLPRLLELRTER